MPLGGTRAVHIHLMLGLPLTARGPAYTAARLAEACSAPGFQTTLYTPLDRWSAPRPGIGVVSGGSGWLGRAGRFLEPRLRERAGEQLLASVRNELRAGEVRPLAWMFGEVPIEVTRALSAEGVTVVREKFNCAKATARAILEAEHQRLNLPPFSEIDDEALAKEAEEVALADALFSPSPMVTQSLLALGVPRHKLLETSYGWEPERLRGDHRALPPVEGVTLVFVGLACVRKGAHLLLHAWERAVDGLGVRGRLLLAGKVDPVIAQRHARQLARSDVVQLGFTDDVGAVYRSADWFVFPTLEEGSPLVTYEALGSGVPALTSPMGAGALIRDGIEGVILDPAAGVEGWAGAIAALPRGERHASMAAAGRARAAGFTWENVGAERRAMLLERLV